MLRTRWALWLLLAACRSTPAPSEQKPTTSARSDLDGLTRWLKPPPGTKSVRWMVRALGVADPRVPGPTDTVLTVFVEIDAAKWHELEAVMPAGPPGELELDEVVAAALLPSAATLPQRKGLRVVAGPTYKLGALPRSPYVGEVAVRHRDGLVLQLFSQ